MTWLWWVAAVPALMLAAPRVWGALGHYQRAWITTITTPREGK